MTADAEKRDALVSEYNVKESEYRASIVKEDDAGPTRNSQLTAKTLNSASWWTVSALGKVVSAVAHKELPEGPEREVQQAYGIGGHSASRCSHWRRSAGSRNTGAAATFTGDEPNTSPRDIIAAVFPQSAAAFAGIMGESVRCWVKPSIP